MVHALVKIIGDFYFEEILNPFIIVLVNYCAISFIKLQRILFKGMVKAMGDGIALAILD